MSTGFGVQRAGLITKPPTSAEIASVINQIIGYGKVELSQDRLAEILLNMLNLIDSGGGGGVTPPATTTVQLAYASNILTVTVNGVSAQVGINPVIGGNVYTYSAGGGVMVKATGLGVTASIVPGLLVITVPNNVQVLSARVHGSSADIDASNNITVRFDNLSDVTNSANLFPPTPIIYDRIFGTDPTFVVPYTYNISNTPQAQIIAVGVKTITMKFINMNAYLNWGMLLNF